MPAFDPGCVKCFALWERGYPNRRNDPAVFGKSSWDIIGTVVTRTSWARPPER